MVRLELQKEYDSKGIGPKSKLMSKEKRALQELEQNENVDEASGYGRILGDNG